MKLFDTFKSPEAKVTKAIVIIDLVDSTRMKVDTVRATWIPTYGWFYDTTSQIVEQFGGQVTKFLGDGIFAVFGEDDVASAINASISIQEAFADAKERGDVDCNCSIGIASEKLWSSRYAKLPEFTIILGQP